MPLLVGGLEHVLFFHVLGIIIPTVTHSIIFLGVETTNQMENAIEIDNFGVGNRQKNHQNCRWVSTLDSIPCALLAMTGSIVESHLVAVGWNDQLGDDHDKKNT